MFEHTPYPHKLTFNSKEVVKRIASTLASDTFFDCLLPAADQPLEHYLQQQTIITQNVKNLFLTIIYLNSLDNGVLGGDIRVFKDENETTRKLMSLQLLYLTQSGEIFPRDIASDGHSVIRTGVEIQNQAYHRTDSGWEIDWSKKPTYTIKLHYDLNALNPVELLTGQNSKGRLIVPERLAAHQSPHQVGEYVDHLGFADSDSIIYLSMTVFNQLYGKYTSA